MPPAPRARRRWAGDPVAAGAAPGVLPPTLPRREPQPRHPRRPRPGRSQPGRHRPGPPGQATFRRPALPRGEALPTVTRPASSSLPHTLTVGGPRMMYLVALLIFALITTATWYLAVALYQMLLGGPDL